MASTGIENEQILNAIQYVVGSVMDNMTGSAIWRNQPTSNYIVSGTQTILDTKIGIRIRDYVDPDGNPILPDSQLKPDWLNAGSYTAMIDVTIPEGTFSIHGPHNRPENKFHIQAGNDWDEFATTENVDTYENYLSTLSLKTLDRNDALMLIEKYREKLRAHMKPWDKLSQVNVENKEKYQIIFAEIVKKIQSNSFPLNIGEEKKEDYTLVVEDNRMNCYFVHIVPEQVYDLFKEMQQKAPNEVLGFSVMAGKYNNKEIRVSCFGIPCNLLGKALFEVK